MIAAYVFVLGLGLQGMEAGQGNETYLSCTYFDFNRDIGYRSRVFSAKNSATDLTAFNDAFAKAIRDQYKVAVDMRHVRCDTVGQWRVQAELLQQSALDSGTAQMPANGRRVDWPKGG